MSLSLRSDGSRDVVVVFREVVIGIVVVAVVLDVVFSTVGIVVVAVVVDVTLCALAKHLYVKMIKTVWEINKVSVLKIIFNFLVFCTMFLFTI